MSLRLETYESLEKELDDVVMQAAESKLTVPWVVSSYKKSRNNVTFI